MARKLNAPGREVGRAVVAPPATAPLWPQPIPVIGLTGDYASGKTLFGLTICPGGSTRVYDTEKSSESYQTLGFDRVDVPQEMLARFKGRHKPVDTFQWWRDHVRSIEPGRFRVVMLDTVSEIESGIYDYVFAHPEEFGRTRAQYMKSSALVWGDVKELWKSILSDLASRCETFVFAAHLRQVWAGNAPTHKKAPKGKSTLEELASLYLWLERKADSKGNVPAVPSAIVRKSRLAHTRVAPDGGVEIVPALPPRLPVATPAAIREYQQTPPDYARLADGERAPEEVLSDDDRAELRARTAEAEADAERLRLERLDREERRKRPREGRAVASPSSEPEREGGEPGELARPAPAPLARPAESRAQPAEEHASPVLLDDGLPVTEEQLERMAELRAELFEVQGIEDAQVIGEKWSAILGRRGVTSARFLTEAQAGELIATLAGAISEIERQEDGTAEAGEATESFPPADDPEE